MEVVPNVLLISIYIFSILYGKGYVDIKIKHLTQTFSVINNFIFHKSHTIPWSCIPPSYSPWTTNPCIYPLPPPTYKNNTFLFIVDTATEKYFKAMYFLCYYFLFFVLFLVLVITLIIFLLTSIHIPIYYHYGSILVDVVATIWLTSAVYLMVNRY